MSSILISISLSNPKNFSVPISPKKKKLETIFFNLLSQFLKILPLILISLSDGEKKKEKKLGS